MENRAPRVLLRNQFREAGHPIYREECNCACPGDSSFLTAPAVSLSESVCCADLYVQDLSQSYTAMFNPMREVGVAVLNAPARRLWEQFHSPQQYGSLSFFEQDASRAAVRAMVGAGLLEQANTQVQLCQAAPQALSVWLHVTNRCNLECDYCYVAKTDSDMTDEVGQAAIDSVIRSAVRGGFKEIKLKFAGGEPTLNLKLVYALHAYALKQATRAGLTLDAVLLSNGVALDEHAMEEHRSRDIRIMISLDGIGDVHDSQRRLVDGDGSFVHVHRTLEALVAKGIRPFVSITVTNRNAAGLADVVDYVLDLDLPFNLNFFRDGCGTVSQPDLSLVDDHVIKSILRAFAVIEAKLPVHSLLGSLVDRAQFAHPHHKTCGVGESYVAVDHLGRIAKCHMTLDEPITDVHSENPLSAVRQVQSGIRNVSADQKEDCRECEWRYWCAGGCPLVTFRATCRYDARSPYCRIYKAIFPALLRLEGLRLLKLSRLWPEAN